jgi:Sigma-70, region 4
VPCGGYRAPRSRRGWSLGPEIHSPASPAIRRNRVFGQAPALEDAPITPFEHTERITLAELADEFGVSRERVRQIEARAFEKVQEALKNRVATIEPPVHQPMH